MNIVQDIRKILILGDSGYIGTRLKQYLADKFRNVEVVGKSMPELDLTNPEDAGSLIPLFDASTVLIMCAGIKKQLGDSLESFSQNVHMAVNLARLLQEQPVLRVIFFSSAAVYGEDVENDAITEDTPARPTSYYGLAKYASERLLEKTCAGCPGGLLVLRPALVYGADDDAGGYGPSGFMRACAREEAIALWGDGSELREFIYVDDLVKIVGGLTFQEYKGTVNVVSGRSYSFREALDCASRLTGVSVQATSRPRTKSKVDHKFDNTLLRRLMPGFRFTGLDDGMRRTLQAEIQKVNRPGDVGVGWGA